MSWINRSYNTQSIPRNYYRFGVGRLRGLGDLMSLTSNPFYLGGDSSVSADGSNSAFNFPPPPNITTAPPTLSAASQGLLDQLGLSPTIQVANIAAATPMATAGFSTPLISGIPWSTPAYLAIGVLGIVLAKDLFGGKR